MRAGKLVAGISCVWILASGCSMCQHPSYDCGPVWTQDGRSNCDPDYRAGSILNRRAQGDMAVEAAPAAKESPAPAVRPVPPAAQPARVTVQPSDGLGPPRRATAAAEPAREIVLRTPVENEATHAPPGDAILPDAPCRTVCRRARSPRRRAPRKAPRAFSRSPIIASMSCSETRSPWRMRTRPRRRPRRSRARTLADGGR